MSDIALPMTGVLGLPRGARLLSDERLAKLAGRGDARAFAALYERNHQAIYRYCRSILHHDQDAQDALQSTMMRAYAALRAQERDLAVRPWLFRIAHNEAISIVRKRRPSVELGEDREHLGGGVESAVEARERLSTLVADLQALPERQRAALLMRELSDLSIAEIAGALAISQGAAKQTLFEARSSLHELAGGRAMQCEAVREAISLRDGRVLRGRRIRAHLRACEECRSFRAAIGARGAELRALAPPLPAAAASAMLARLLAHGGSHGSGAAVSGASLGGHAAASLFAKGLAGVVVVAAATAGTVRLATEKHYPAAGKSGSAATARSAGYDGGTGSPIGATRLGSSRQTGKLGSLAVLSSLQTRGTSERTGGGGAFNNDAGSSIAGGSTQTSLSRHAFKGGSGTNGHDHSRGTGSSSQGSERHSNQRHWPEGQGPAAGQRSHHPTRSPGSTPHRPPHESHGEAGQGPGAGLGAQVAPAQQSETPSGEAPRNSTGAGNSHTPQGSEAGDEAAAGRSGEARQTTPQPQSANEGAAPR